MWEWNLSGAKTNVKWLPVAEDGDKGGLEEESEVSELVDHSLLGKGQVSGLADHQISPLDADDGAEVSGLSNLKGLGGVAKWEVVGGVRSSVEPWVASVGWVPSAFSEVFWLSGSGVEESGINLGHLCLVPSESLPSWRNHLTISIILLFKPSGVGVSVQ